MAKGIAGSIRPWYPALLEKLVCQCGKDDHGCAISDQFLWNAIGD